MNLDIFMRHKPSLGIVRVLSGDYKASVLQSVLLDAAVTWVLSIPFIFSKFGMFLGFFLVIEIFILGWRYIGTVKRNRRTYEPQQVKRLDPALLRRMCRISWAVYFCVEIIFLIYNAISHTASDYSSLYAVCRSVSDWLSPLLLASVPVIFNCAYTAALECGENDVK